MRIIRNLWICNQLTNLACVVFCAMFTFMVFYGDEIREITTNTQYDMVCNIVVFGTISAVAANSIVWIVRMIARRVVTVRVKAEMAQPFDA